MTALRFRSSSIIDSIISVNFKNIISKLMSYQVGGKNLGEDVYLNVYDLEPNLNQSCYGMGLGLYHSGIQLGLNEYTFGGHNDSSTGVMELTPKTNTPNFRESIHLGKTTLNWRQINKILDGLREAFPGNSYHIVRKNCNTFTNCFCEALLDKKIPSYVNRLANMGKVFLEIDDFLRMRPYDSKFQVSAKALGIEGQSSKKTSFEGASGVMIG